MQRKFYLPLLIAFAFTTSSFAQISSTALKGKVTDKESGETLPFVNVVVFLNGNLVTGTTTDIDGEYTIKPIDPGSYELQFSFVGYATQTMKGVVIKSNIINYANATLSTASLDVVEIIEYTVPLIDKDGGASGGTVTREEIEKMPGRSALGFATTVAGVGTAGTGGGISIRGARTDATWVYIDGIKVRGSAALPKSAIEEVSVITGGIPASIGDATGGVINISLRNSSSTFTGGAEVITSGFKSGDKAVGLDHYGYNLVEGSVSGPLLSKKNTEGIKERPLLGFFISGNYTDIVDPAPAFGSNYKMTDSARQSILDNPLRLNTGETGGALYNADFLGSNDFEKINTNLNARNKAASLVAKIDVNTSPNMTLTVGGTGAYNRYHAFSRGNQLMNWENNAQVTEVDWRGYVKFSQRFRNSEDSEESSTLKNVFYSVMLDYSKTYDLNQDDTHKDELFKYGHIGTFETTRARTYTQEDFNGYYTQSGTQDVNVNFTPSSYNPDLAAINSQYFSLFEVSQPVLDVLSGQNLILTDDPIINPNNPSGPPTTELALISDDSYANYENIQGGLGMLNGDSPPATYGLWPYVGTPSNNYSVGNTRQFRVTAAGSADVGDHAIQIGFEYEQRKDAFFGVSPVGLWGLGRLLANSHTAELDKSDPSSFNVGSALYVNYPQLIGNGQYEFDYNLRESLGLDPLGGDWINIDALDPSDLSLDMFGAEDLLNQGNNFVIYYGYDHHGNKVEKKPTIDDFFSQQYQLGDSLYYTRPMGAFEPIYTSGYIMDKFAFDDLIFNVGVRIDRFDANQPIPKDPYVINEAYTAGETDFAAFNAERPSNIEDDFVVYVNDVEQPTGVAGYRDGDIWYNSQGLEISDPDAIAVGGKPNPYLKNNPDDPLNSGAFKDYEPAVNVMPRIAFSFPISDEALFFAHYDILTQRPTSSNRFNPIDYLYLETRGGLISNPNLKPEKTVDYALGFQQILSKASSIKIEAYYRELRDMIQVRSFSGAYPASYNAFGNLDFGTVKGLSLTYDLRRTGNIWIKTSYTLQFADGTGSTTQTALALINAGQPNLRTISPLNYDQRHRIVTTLDYRYGEGADYNGPVLFDKPILQNTGINFIANFGSGTPYTAQRNITSLDAGGSPSTEGSINGSRLSSQFTIDINIDKNINLKFGGEGDKAKTASLNVYLWISNLLNTKNINSVYRYTGTDDDDGYLSSAQAQPVIASQSSPESYKNYYSMLADNPYNLGSPRTIRLGLRFDF